jgi:hypothetical protein
VVGIPVYLQIIRLHKEMHSSLPVAAVVPKYSPIMFLAVVVAGLQVVLVTVPTPVLVVAKLLVVLPVAVC